MTLYQLLVNIQQGIPINFAVLCKKLPITIKWQDFLIPEPISNNKHRVTIKNTEIRIPIPMYGII